MTSIKASVLIFFALVVSSCAKKTLASRTVNSEVSKALWVDQTHTYLPTTAEWTNRVEVADINADGMIDLLFANGGNYSEPGELEPSRIFINKGPDKLFEEITTQVFGDAKFWARVIKVRDINQDGIADIVIGTTYQSQSQLYLGTGNGKFKNATQTHFPTINASIGDLEFGDVDADGDLDLVLTDWGPGSNMNNQGGRTMLWLNDGQGHFNDVTTAQMPELLIQFSWDLEFFDFDNDFDLDVAISCKRCGTSRMFVNDGKGNFEDKRLLPAYTNNYDFEIMDINKDGFLDMVTINDGEIVNGDSGSRREHIFLNMKGEKFVDATHELWPDVANVGMDDNNISFLDYDSDGDPDFLISSLTGEDRLLVNDGSGKFSLEQPVLKGAPSPLTLSIVLGDINNDKKLDIIMGQGEGDEGIEERIFIGNDLAVDTAAPVISHYKLEETPDGTAIRVYARVHDNKSPNMPQDWASVMLNIDTQNTVIDMSWYGENLWVATLPNAKKINTIELCATDYSGNKSCKKLK